MSRIRDALDRIEFARGYTLRLIDTIPLADWFQMPAEGVTHVAWQVGHIAYAQYRLTVFRLRGERPEDEQLFPMAFRKSFVPDTVPSPDAAQYPPAKEIRTVLDRVHALALSEVAAFPDGDLDSPITPPHDIAKTKLQVLHWCAAHELVHAGQIGLLRRLYGQPPIW